MGRAGRWLLAWGVLLIALAEVVRHLPLGRKTAIAVGLVELLLAVATGVTFGLLTARKDVRG